MDYNNYHIIETRVVNGKKTERIITDNPIPFDVAVMAISIIADDIEDNDKVFGNYRTELVNEGTPQENYKFGWDGDTDFMSVYDCIEATMSWGISMVGNADFELSYRLVQAEETFCENKRAAICINTAACVYWATTDEPLIQRMQTKEEFVDLGFHNGEYDKVMAEGLDKLTTTESNDYEGVYIVGYTY